MSASSLKFWLLSHAATDPYLQLDHPLAKVGRPSLLSLRAQDYISEDDGAPRAKAVQQAERTPPCSRGRSAHRRPPDASRRSRPTPRRCRCHRGFVRGRHGRTRLVVRSLPRTDRRCHTVTCVGGNPPLVPQGVAQRSFGRVSAHAFVVIETMWPTKSIQRRQVVN